MNAPPLESNRMRDGTKAREKSVGANRKKSGMLALMVVAGVVGNVRGAATFSARELTRRG